MRREHSRITLEVTEVSVQRLQDITEEAALAEGIESWEERGYDDAQDYYRDYITGGAVYTAMESFRTLWESINGAMGPKSWNANPWIWVVGFKVIRP